MSKHLVTVVREKNGFLHGSKAGINGCFDLSHNIGFGLKTPFMGL